MNAAKREALTQAGFRIGTAQEFLGLEDWENRLVELKYRLSRQAKSLREVHGLTQQSVAKIIRSSQSRVAKIEAGSEDVSLDLLIRYFYAVGGRLGEPDPEGVSLPKQHAKPVVARRASAKPRQKKRVAV